MGIDKRALSCYNFHMDNKRIYSYEPVIDSGCRTLILGTMPSVKSLEAGFYYAHPRNAFWRILAEVLGERMPESTDEKKHMLLKNHIAIWDTASSCVRQGSLDSSMRDVELNDFEGLFEAYPGIERVLLNGGEAWKLYHQLPEDIVKARERVKLPSTSPAYTMPYEQKLKFWRDALLREGYP